MNKKRIITILKILVVIFCIASVYTFVNYKIGGKNDFTLRQSDSYKVGSRYESTIRITSKENQMEDMSEYDIKAKLYDNDGKPVGKAVYKGKTNKNGIANISFDLPNDLQEGKYKLKVTCSGKFRKDKHKFDVNIVKDNLDYINISLDKGIYKPGDSVKYSAMIVSKNDLVPSQNSNIKVNIYDGNDNRVYSEETNSTEYGIVSGTFTLADEVNSGTYTIEVNTDDGMKERKNFTVNPYVTPQFEVNISRDKDVYLKNDIANITINAKYFFGENVVNAKVIGNVDGKEFQGYTDEQGNLVKEVPLNEARQYSLKAQVVDSSNYLVEAETIFVASKDVFNVEFYPELGMITKGVDNIIYVHAKDPNGKALKTHNELVIGNNLKKQVITDDKGIGSFTITESEVNRVFSSTGEIYVSGRSKNVETQEEINIRDTIEVNTNSNTIIKTDKTKYNQGDTIDISLINAGKNGSEILVLKDNQIVKSISFEENSTSLELDDLSGIIDLYLIGEVKDNDLVKSTYYNRTRYNRGVVSKKTIFIKPKKQLSINISNGSNDTYKPGEEVSFEFETFDENNKNVESNLLLSIIDKSVLSIAENDLSIDNIKIALQDLKIDDKNTLADLYVNIIDEGSDTLFDEIFLKQKIDTSIIKANYYDSYANDVLLLLALLFLILTCVNVIIIIVIKHPEGAKKFYTKIIKSFVILVGLTLIIYIAMVVLSYDIEYDGVFSDLGNAVDTLLYLDVPILFLTISLFAAGSYLLFFYRYREFLFDFVINTVFIPIVLDGLFYIFYDLMYSFTVVIPIIIVLVFFIICIIIAKIRKNISFITSFLKKCLYALMVAAAVKVSRESIVLFIVGLIFLNIIEYAWIYKKKREKAIKDGKLVLNITANQIVGLVLLLIMVVVISFIALYIYTSSQATIQNSMTDMSTGEYSGGGITFDSITSDDTIRGSASDTTGTASSAKSILPSFSLNSKTDEAEDTSVVEERIDEYVNEEETDIAVGTASKEKEEKVRNVFLESLAFIPDIVTQNGKASQNITLSDNITTWNIQVVGNTKDGNIGYNSSEIKVFKDFFVNFTLPTNSVITDKVSIPVTVYNYTQSDMNVSLNVVQNDWSNIGEYTREVVVAPNQTTMVYVPLEIIKEGANTLRIEAKSNGVQDIVEKQMVIKPNGIETEEVVSSGMFEDKYVQDVIYDENAVDGTKSLKVKLYPSIEMQAIENIDAILKMPTGCFEQVSSSLYPDILVLKYMKNKGIKDDELENKAKSYISSGYQKILSYEVHGTSGGYSLYGNSPAEPVLTAFGLMELSDASEVYDIDENVIEEMKNYLFGVQSGNGTFKYSSTYIGGSESKDEVAMNAYIIWALSEVAPKDKRLEKSVDYLKSKYKSQKDPYTVALIANVFANVEANEYSDAIDMLSKCLIEDESGIHVKSEIRDYYGSHGSYQNVQSTALTAMAYAKDMKNNDVKKMMNYLVSAKSPNGSWGTTQSTILALKAIASVGNEDDIKNQKVIVKLNNEEKEIDITKDTLSYYEVEFENVSNEGKLEIDNEKGSFVYEIIKSYYETYEEALLNKNTGIALNQNITKTGLVNDIIYQTINLENISNSNIDNAQLQIYIPQGASVDESSLMMLQSRGLIEKYEYNYSTINLYLRNFEKNMHISLDVKYRANYPVDVTGAVIRAYDYYNPEVSGLTLPENIVIN